MHPIIIAILLVNQFDMGGRDDFLMAASVTATRSFDMGGLTEPDAKALPEVWAYSMPGCLPCVRAKLELSAAKDLPFKVVWQDKSPDWLGDRPAFWWHVKKDKPSQDEVQQTRQFVGWAGIKDFVERWKRSREIKETTTTDAAAAPTPYAEVVRVLSLLPTPQIGFVDFGCGDARWCIAAAERWPNCRITGVELDPSRAAAARERVRAAGLDGHVTIITGDVLTTDVQADVGVAYLYGETLSQLKPRLEKLRAFASYMHRPAGLPATQNGDTWFYTAPVVAQSRPAAVWQGQYYSGPVCNRAGCKMCESLRNQLGMPRPSHNSIWSTLF